MDYIVLVVAACVVAFILYRAGILNKLKERFWPTGGKSGGDGDKRMNDGEVCDDDAPLPSEDELYRFAHAKLNRVVASSK